ncbi:MAG: nucleotidyltransferase family protein [Vampirovibrionales bacterium]
MKQSKSDVLKRLILLKPSLQEDYGIEHLWLFGSVARDEATEASDVDLLYQPSKPLGLELMTLWNLLEEQLGCKVDLGDLRYVKARLKDAIAKDLFDVF